MVRRTSKKTKAENVTIDLTRLTKEGLLILQRYVDHGQRLPTVSSKTSYKDIWRHTKKFNTTRKTMTALASKIQASSRQATITYCPDLFDLPKEEFQGFLSKQSRSIDGLLDDCEKMLGICEEFEKESESDLAKLQAEVTRLKVATNSKERRDLLVEITRAVPVISQVKDLFNQLSDGLKAIQHQLDISEDSSDGTFNQILAAWGGVFSTGVQFLLQ
ncbi:hypothetical protein B0H16DRAFT_1565505 [Mycena metata]|uniref:Uncharacterized protein n=1 Tax=Mycena metata TaxID=1033252 RepID=A0AAD7N0M2_9AGAR|nr:hypothetical protein B0H16DRAFT_1565505 [Mycena metata]